MFCCFNVLYCTYIWMSTQKLTFCAMQVSCPNGSLAHCLVGLDRDSTTVFENLILRLFPNSKSITNWPCLASWISSWGSCTITTTPLLLKGLNWPGEKCKNVEYVMCNCIVHKFMPHFVVDSKVHQISSSSTAQRAMPVIFLKNLHILTQY